MYTGYMQNMNQRFLCLSLSAWVTKDLCLFSLSLSLSLPFKIGRVGLE